METKTKKVYAIDVHWDVAKCFRIEAESAEDAERIMNERINKGEVSVWTDGFETTDDVEVSASGEANEDGTIQYY